MAKLFGENLLLVCFQFYTSFEISFRYLNCYVSFIVIIILKLQQISEFWLFVFKYEGGFKISVLLFR